MLLLFDVLDVLKLYFGVAGGADYYVILGICIEINLFAAGGAYGCKAITVTVTVAVAVTIIVTAITAVTGACVTLGLGSSARGSTILLLVSYTLVSGGIFLISRFHLICSLEASGGFSEPASSVINASL